MATNHPLILFVGPHLSGRTSTLWCVADLSRTEIDFADIAGKKRPLSIEWSHCDGSQVSFNALVAGAISRFAYAEKEEVLTIDWARRDLLLLKECDGLVLLLDAQEGAVQHQQEFYKKFRQWLQWAGRDLGQIPSVVLLNKKDLDSGEAVLDWFNQVDLIPLDHVFPSIAVKGVGIRRAVDCLLHQLL